MRNAVRTERARIGIAVSFLTISGLVFAAGVAKVTIWAIADSLGEESQPQRMHAWGWLLMAAAMLQLVLAGPIGRLLTQPLLRRSRIIFDLFSIVGAGLIVYVTAAERSPFLAIGVAIAALTLWIIWKLEERWLAKLSFVWLISVALVLSSLIYGASHVYAAVWLVVIVAALLAVQASIRLGRGLDPAPPTD